MKSAEALFHEAFSSPAYTDFLEYNRKCWPEFLLSRQRYQEALVAARELTASQWPLARLAGHTLAGQALLGAGSVAEAKEELTLAERETERLPARAVAALRGCSKDLLQRSFHVNVIQVNRLNVHQVRILASQKFNTGKRVMA